MCRCEYELMRKTPIRAIKMRHSRPCTKNRQQKYNESFRLWFRLGDCLGNPTTDSHGHYGIYNFICQWDENIVQMRRPYNVAVCCFVNWFCGNRHSAKCEQPINGNSPNATQLTADQTNFQPRFRFQIEEIVMAEEQMQYHHPHLLWHYSTHAPIIKRKAQLVFPIDTIVSVVCSPWNAYGDDVWLHARTQIYNFISFFRIIIILEDFMWNGN